MSLASARDDKAQIAVEVCTDANRRYDVLRLAGTDRRVAADEGACLKSCLCTFSFRLANIPLCSAALARHVCDKAEFGKNSRLCLTPRSARLAWLHKKYHPKLSFGPKHIQVSGACSAGPAAKVSYLIKHCFSHVQREAAIVREPDPLTSHDCWPPLWLL